MNFNSIKYTWILTAFFLIGCGSETTEDNTNQTVVNGPGAPSGSSNFKIEGTIDNSGGQVIYLYEYGGEKPLAIDSAIVNDQGSFSLSAPGKGFQFYGIGKDITKVVALLLKGDETISVNCDNGNMMFGSTVEGSEDTKLMNEFSVKNKAFFDEMNSLQQSIQELPYEDQVNRERIVNEANSLKEEFDQYKYLFIEKNTSSPAVYMAASELRNFETDLDYLKMIEKSLAENMNGSPYHQDITRRIQQFNEQAKAMEQQAKMIEQQKQSMIASGIGPGLEAPELNFPGTDGKMVSLHSLRGKVVLLDFWASWCKPCRMENPNVVRLYNQYKDKGFTIYSFSLDQDANKWKAAIKTDGLIWPYHASDLGGWQSKGAAVYKVNSIPQTFLIGADGKIIDMGLRGPQLEAKLKELLG